MFLAFKDAGATDWNSHLEISLDHAGMQHRLQFHHIFPKAVLSKAGYTPREADDISNLAFIGGKTNRVISDKQPKDYFIDLIQKNGTDCFKKQEIPLDDHLLITDAYKEFLKIRRQKIVSKINEFLFGMRLQYA
jgi:hypothetical protein